MIVIDASAAVSALLTDGQARRLLAVESVQRAAPGDLIRNAASSLLERVWELRAAVTTCDAMHVALAENLDCALVTTDARLSGVNLVVP